MTEKEKIDLLLVTLNAIERRLTQEIACLSFEIQRVKEVVGYKSKEIGEGGD